MRHHVHSVFVISLLLLAAALLVGCSKDGASVIERYKAPGLAQLKRLQVVAEMMRDRPPLIADTPSLPFATASFQTNNYPPTDGALVLAEWLTEEGLQKDSFNVESVGVVKDPFWGRSWAWLITGKNPDGSPPERRYPGISMEEDLQAFVKVKYLGVVRTVEFRSPQVTGENSYMGGRYRVDIFFFELADTPKYLGGLLVDAVNDPERQFQYKTESREEDMRKELVSNLDYRSREAFDKVMAEHTKGNAVNSKSSK
jgi:hypothetical protein